MLARDSAQQERAKRIELLAWCLEDFRRFAGLIDIVTKSGQRQKFKFWRYQSRYCDARTVRDIILKARQIGFTTFEQVRDLFHFLTVPGARVVVTCQSITGSDPLKQLSKNFQVMFQSLERAGLKLNFRRESFTEWSLADRDASLRIIEAGASEAAAQKKGRAGTVSRLHLTETAFYEYADETLNALLECVPTVEHGSEIVSESTPNGATGFFFHQCKNAAASVGAYKFHFIPWYSLVEQYATALEPGETITPTGDREKLLAERGVTPEQLKWYRAKVLEKGQDKTDQEYPSDPDTCFLVSGRTFFERAVTNRLIERAPAPLERRDRDRIAIWKKPAAGARYLISADTAEGGGGDPSGAVVRDRSTGEHCATVFGQYQPWELAAALAKLGLEYNTALVVVERNNHGHAVLQALHRELKYPAIYVHDDDKQGWPTNSVTRPTMLDALEDAHRKGGWKSNCRATLGQMSVFVITPSGKAEAARGEHDDLVLAEAIGWAVRQRPVRTYDGIGRAKSGWT